MSDALPTTPSIPQAEPPPRKGPGRPELPPGSVRIRVVTDGKNLEKLKAGAKKRSVTVPVFGGMVLANGLALEGGAL